jgi:predicted metal-dependent hydrolase
LTQGELRSIEIYGRVIVFQLKRTERRTLSISVDPDCRVVVTAPADAAVDLVDSKVRLRAQWIRQQQKHFESLPLPMPPRRWISGETHRYVGRQYRLKVTSAPDSAVRLAGPFFEVVVPDPDNPQAVKTAMNAWYQAHAQVVLQARLLRLLEGSTWLLLPAPPQLTVRRMRLRWGSTTASSRVCLNVDLVKMPLGCIDYVIAHELAHLKFRNHGASFWRLLGQLYPEWERWRDKLNQQEVDSL